MKMKKLRSFKTGFSYLNSKSYSIQELKNGKAVADLRILLKSGAHHACKIVFDSFEKAFNWVNCNDYTTVETNKS